MVPVSSLLVRSMRKTLMERNQRFRAEIERMAGGAGSERSVGGMVTKVRAAKRLAAQGVATALLSGRRPKVLRELLEGANVGTFFAPAAERLDRRKGWLASAAKGKGVILVDPGAQLFLGRSSAESGVAKGTSQLSEQKIVQWAPAGPSQAFDVFLAALEQVDLPERLTLHGDLVESFPSHCQALAQTGYMVNQLAHPLRGCRGLHKTVLQVVRDQSHVNECHVHDQLPGCVQHGTAQN